MYKIFLFAIFTFLAAGAARAGQPDAVTAALDGFSSPGANALSAEAPAPRWRSSLGGIEESTGGLVQSNRELSAQNRELLGSFNAMQTAIEAQQAANGRALEALRQRQEIVGSSRMNDDLKVRLAAARKERLQVADEWASVNARIRAAESRAALRRLKIEELTIEKKALVLDGKERGDGALGMLRAAVASLKERVAFQKGQVVFVRQKTEELSRLDRPYLKDFRRVSAENDALRQELAGLTGKRDGQARDVDAMVAAREKSLANADVKRFLALTAQKAALENRIAAAQSRHDALALKLKEEAVTARDIEQKSRDLEAANAEIEGALANVRENVAVLDYRINTLTRYKGRKQ